MSDASTIRFKMWKIKQPETESKRNGQKKGVMEAENEANKELKERA